MNVPSPVPPTDDPARDGAVATTGADGRPAPSVFDGPGQEYELAFFLAAAVLTVLVAAGFIFVIVRFGGESPTADDGEGHPPEGRPPE